VMGKLPTWEEEDDGNQKRKYGLLIKEKATMGKKVQKNSGKESDEKFLAGMWTKKASQEVIGSCSKGVLERCEEGNRGREKGSRSVRGELSHRRENQKENE